MAVLAAVAVASGIMALALAQPAILRWLPGCPLHALTGWHCPGCGTTRALHQLLHGHIAAAFGLNPLTMTLLPVAVYVAIRGARAFAHPGWLYSLAVVAALFGVLRNVPLYPFTLLAP
jgi:hypothetical protein